jgi:hypothetical protein
LGIVPALLTFHSAWRWSRADDPPNGTADQIGHVARFVMPLFSGMSYIQGP